MQGVSTQSEMKLIKLLLATYVYDAPLGTFILLPDLPSGVPIQLHLATAALDAIDRGLQADNMPDCGRL